MAFDLPFHLGTVDINGQRYEIMRKTAYYSGKEIYDLKSLETGELHQMTYYKPEPHYEKRSDGE